MPLITSVAVEIVPLPVTGLPITVAEDPLSAVVLGTGKILDEIDLLKKVSI